jgi:putative membrane-bound dehydrogenase-like protein
MVRTIGWIGGAWMAVAVMASAPTDVKKTWLTPLDPKVAKLPLEFPPRSPAESASMIQVPAGYEVELMAAEPMVLDPVAVAWGPDGRVWVVEMADYPLGMDDRGAPGSRIRCLQDTDGDGKLDKSTLFADKLNFANSCAPWRNGLLVTCAPEIVYLEDCDGDGKADLRKTLYTGFDEGNPQLRINGLRFGLDNWLYCANGLRTQGKIGSTQSGDVIASMSGLDFRIRPDEGRLQAQSGATEFGRVCSDDGDWFGNDNSNPLWHFVLEDHYLKRNRNVAPPEVKVQLVTPRNTLIYPLSKLQQRFNVDYMANRITSACGPEIYRDQLLFPRYAALMGFTCEPVHNMILRTVIEPAGPTFSGRRDDSEQRSEFIASTDNWFRPVMVRTGPDGALWICDMYRYTVEHPAYMTEEWRSKLPLRAGDDMGRLYRVYPKGKRPAPIKRLDTLDTAGLVAALDSANGVQRELAQQMLLWKADPAAAPLLEGLASASANPHARLHAICALDGLKAITDDRLVASMKDAHPAVRRHAVRICESRGSSSAVVQAACRLADDPDAKVRMQLALTLGEWDDPRAGAALGRIAVRDAADVYLVAAVMSSAMRHHGAIVDAVLDSGRPSGDMLRSLLDMSAALNNRAAAAKLMHRVLTPDGGQFAGWQLEAFAGWLDALPRQKTSLAKLAAAQQDDLTARLEQAPTLFDAARRIAADVARPPADRAAAVRLLCRQGGAEADDAKLAASLLNPRTPSTVQSAAVAAVGRAAKVDPVDLLLAGWESHGPEVRLAVTELLFRSVDNTRRVLQLAADGKLAGFDVEFTRRERLFKHKDKSIAELARKALGKPSSESRAKVVADYQSITQLAGDAKRGADVFARACAVCHRIGDVGKDIGPDLRSVTDRSPGGLLTAILDPNHDIDPKYYAYLAVLNSGETLMGVLTSETATAVTILGMDANPRTVLRQDLQSLRSTGRSLMIEGLEAAINKQDMADLIRYLGYPGQ